MLCYFFIIFLQYTGWKTLIGFIQNQMSLSPEKLKHCCNLRGYTISRSQKELSKIGTITNDELSIA